MRSRRSCLSLLIIGILLGTMPLHAADIKLSTPKTTQKTAFTTLDGEIVVGDADRMERILEEAKKTGKELAVMLTSNGGDWNEAMAVGRVIRKYHADTYHGYCAFACVLAFLGGERRLFHADADNANLVISRPEILEGSFNSASPALKEFVTNLRTYVVEQTGAAVFLDLLLATPVQTPKTLTADEAQNSRTTTASIN